MTAEAARIGLICPPDHAVFSGVADRLRTRGHDVVFFDPGTALAEDRIDRLDLLVNKKMRWESLTALHYASRAGIPTWNGFEAALLLVNRLAQVSALAAVGFAVPEITPAAPENGAVAKGFFDMRDHAPSGEADFYQPLLDDDRTEYKYYAVDDGRAVHVASVQFREATTGGRGFRERADPDVEQRMRQLLRFVGARAIGVDVLVGDDDRVAVDANVAPSFRHADLCAPLVDSIESALPG